MVIVNNSFVSLLPVGLFTPAEQLLETTLKYAVDHVNTDVALLPNSRLSVQTEMLRPDNALDTYNKVCSRIEEGAVIVFGPSTTAENSLVSSICAAMHVPHLQTTWHQDLDVRPFSLGLVPGPELLGKAFREFVDRMGWLFFAYVYEGDQALVRLQEMERHEDIMGRKVLAFDLGAVGQPADRRRRRQTDAEAGEDDGIQEPKTVWDEIKESGYRNFIIDLPQDRIAGVLQEVISMAIHPYFVIQLLFCSTLDVFKKRATIFATLRDETPVRYKDIVAPLAKTKKTKQFRNPRSSRRRTPKYNSVVTVLSRRTKKIDPFKKFIEQNWRSPLLEHEGCDWIRDLAERRRGTCVQYVIRACDQVMAGRRWRGLLKRVYYVATWSPEKGLDFVHDPHDDDGVPGSEDVDDTIDENSLENRTIIVTTVVSPPFVMLKDGSEQYEGNQRFEGFCVSLLDKLAEVLHFDYKLQLVKPEKFGYEVSPGRWTGLIGELVEGKVDMAAAPLTMTSKRSTVVEFTVPFMTLGIGLMASRQDETLVHSFLSPFSAATWCYLVLSLLVAMALLTLVGRLSPFEWDQVSETRVDTEYTLGNAFWFLFSGFTFQRVTITPRAPSTVVAFISWWIFSLIVMVAYASVLGEFIIRYRDRPTLNSVDDLLKQKDIKYGTYRRGSTQSFFQKSTFPQYMELWQGMQSQGDEAFVDNYYEGIERVIGGNYAMFLESPVLEYLENRYCEIEQVGDIMGSGGYALALPKAGSPYQSELSAAITRLKFDGTLQLLRQYWWEDHNVANCPPEEHVYRPTPFTVRFGRLSLVFIFLLLGLLITMVIMLVIFVRGHSKRDVTAESMSTIWNTLLEELRSAMMCRKEKKPQEATKDGEVTPPPPPPVTVSPA
ncbi:unnamed protein product [Ixodes pacificus]